MFLKCNRPGRRSWRHLAVAALCLASVSCSTLSAQDEPAYFGQWAPTPPMGWNSWDVYGPTVREDEVRANAEYMAEHLKEHGWEYVVVDIRWYVSNAKSGGYQQFPEYNMDEYGRYQPAVNRFPSAEGGKGFKPLADYVHSLGLKFGIHIMRGIPIYAFEKNTPILGTEYTARDVAREGDTAGWLRDNWGVAASRPGAQEYYDSIIQMYADWGVDYIKVDDISRPYAWAEVELIRNAIDKTGRPIVLSLSPGATPLRAAPHVMRHANLWRIQDDFWDNWPALVQAFEDCANWAQHRRRGHWPDADMLPLGRIGIRAERGSDRMTGFTRDEQMTLMSLWSLAQSPLMFGGDLPSNDAWTLSLLTNDEVLAVNQRAFHGRQLFREGTRIAWIAEPDDSNDLYLGLFNLDDNPQTISVNLGVLGFNGRVRVRDLWAREDIGEFEGTIEREINPHGAGLYRITEIPIAPTGN